MDMIEHIKKLCKQRNWTYYRLAVESGIPHSSLNTMLNKQKNPSMNNLIKICGAFDITLAEFFASMEPPSNEMQEVVNLWSGLDRESRSLVKSYMCGLARKEVFEKC